MVHRIFSLIIVLAGITALFSCKNTGNSGPGSKRQLIIFHAGSLSVPISEMVAEFKKGRPNVEILLESAGSRACARKITDLKKECDVMVSADYLVIDNLLIPEYAQWNIKFASNEMAIVYHDKSRYAEKINTDNWYKVLLQDDVIFGRSEPESDPCGYRTVLAIKLAGKYYKLDGFSEKALQKDLNYIRPKEVDLLAMLESGAIDYIFLYRSVAIQHGLKFVALPDEVNLKNPDMADLYATVSVELTGKELGETITQKGEAMVYGITVPENAPDKELAVEFVDFLLSSDQGMKILEKHGQPSVIPLKSETFHAIPEKLKKYAIQ